MKLISAFLSGIMITLTLKSYNLSRDYRYVMRILQKEKTKLESMNKIDQNEDSTSESSRSYYSAQQFMLDEKDDLGQTEDAFRSPDDT